MFKGRKGELGALFQPRFQGWHLDKGSIEKTAKFGSWADSVAGRLAEIGPLKGGLIGGGLGAGIGGAKGYFLPTDRKGQRITDPTSQERRSAALKSALGGGLAGGVLGAHAADVARTFRRYSPTPSWVRGAKTKAEAKKIFRAEAMKTHPDRGGNEEAMKRLNDEWDRFQNSAAFHKLAAAFLDEFMKISSLEGRVLGQLLRKRVQPSVSEAVRDLEDRARARWEEFNS